MNFRPIINDSECTMNTEAGQCCCSCEHAGLLLLPDGTHIGYVCTVLNSFVYYYEKKHRVGCHEFIDCGIDESEE